ncbi:hypothetical protein DAPPUDRAFT_244005 [Daphnia pulex]|uniref:Uncharacterized protein n=1 Tax=Daphnia pulex TaxID=6669 RepID=E9GJZ7_DAPPU|nr:hypothetical protein DAPPUDRAFT_244005 [Daphnia pulex]|eukprot:EFX80239.1 hypothetical protein DAPPUDRAFT_244005 [Daphnia pulex]
MKRMGPEPTMFELECHNTKFNYRTLTVVALMSSIEIVVGTDLAQYLRPDHQVEKQFHHTKFLKDTTGIDYEIHIIQEAAANGSILSLDSDMQYHNKSGAETTDLHLPLAHVSDLFKYHYIPNWKVGYMVNYPGDLNGKISNYMEIDCRNLDHGSRTSGNSKKCNSSSSKS